MLQIVLLDKGQNRKGFSCGDQDLDRYLRETARQHNEKGISRTFVLTDSTKPTQILGYYTLTMVEIVSKTMPEAYGKTLPYRAPAAKLGRLAVAKEAQKAGYGKFMMIDAMRKIVEISERIGIVGMFVDAKNADAAAYYQGNFGFVPLPEQPLHLFLPLATITQIVAVSC